MTNNYIYKDKYVCVCVWGGGGGVIEKKSLRLESKTVGSFNTSFD